MDEHTSLERAAHGQIEAPNVIPVSSYPVELDREGHAPALLEYWRVLRKRYWTVVAILTLVVLTVMIGTLKQRPVYQAKAIIQIDRESPNVLNFQDFISAEANPYDDSYLETAYRLLQSRSLSYRVIKQLNLADSPDFAANPNDDVSWFRRLWPASSSEKTVVSPEEQIDPKYSKAMDKFLENLQVNPVRRSQLAEIEYESYNPALSARVANSVASNFIDMNLEAKWKATQKASDWLSQQLVGLKAKLEKSEEDLQRYAKENAILFLDEKQSLNSQKLQQLQQEATRAEADLIEKESLYNQVKDGDFSSVPGILENKLYQDLSMKLSDLKREYSELTATFTPEYPKVQRLKSQIDETQAAIDREVKSFARRVTDDYQATANRKRLIDQAVAQQTRDFNEIADKSIQYNILKREADTNKQLYEGLLQRMKEASVSAGLRASNVRVVDEAEIPALPSRPRKMLNLALSLLIGLALGVGAAFLQEHLDNSLKTPEEVQRYLRLPVLGVIPTASSNRKLRSGYAYGYASPKSLPAEANGANKSLVLAEIDNNTPLSEAYRSLRTSVLLSSAGHPPRALLIASAHPGEGKTTTTVNLAIALVQLGGRVLVVDSDMRRPRISKLLNLEASSRGISTYLSGQYKLEEVITPTQVPNLYAIQCGPIPPNPAELLSGEQFVTLIQQARKSFSYVLMDSPPVLHVSDARIIASRVEAVVLVAHGTETPREAVRQARNLLQRVNANVIGVALNNVDLNAAGYGYYYRYNGKYGYGVSDGANGAESHPG